MGRRDREDEEGGEFHLHNRGVAKRTVFEDEAGVRCFLSRLAREHRRGRLRVHAFVALANHSHILAESPAGQLSEAVRVVQNEYVRRFNRLRRRDGPLLRGRFGSPRVKSDAYWYTLLRSIDLHSVKDRLATSEGLYPFGSAHHCLLGKQPKWLTRGRVVGLVLELTGQEEFTPVLHERMLSRPVTRAERVVLRMRGLGTGSDPLDELLSAGPSRPVEGAGAPAGGPGGGGALRPGVRAPRRVSRVVPRRGDDVVLAVRTRTEVVLP